MKKYGFLNEPVWDDLLINSGIFSFAGAADPALESWQPGGSGTTYKVYKFKKNDEVYFTCQMPHTYKQGSEIRVHVHWTPGDRGTEESGNYVGWKLDYSIANINGGIFLPSTTIDMSDTCSGSDDYHEVSAGLSVIPGVYGAGDEKLTVSHMLVCRLYRSDTGADDTWVGTTNAQSPVLLQFDLHHQIDSPGSRQEWVK